MSCHSYDRNRFRIFFSFSDLFCSFKAIHFRHLHVHEYKIVRNHFKSLDCLFAVSNGIGPKAQLFQNVQGNHLVGNVILGNQDSNLASMLFGNGVPCDDWG